MTEHKTVDKISQWDPDDNNYNVCYEDLTKIIECSQEELVKWEASKGKCKF